MYVCIGIIKLYVNILRFLGVQDTDIGISEGLHKLLIKVNISKTRLALPVGSSAKYVSSLLITLTW